MDWDDVRHFLALARTGSVRAAGAMLGVSHSTVARRVEGLEARLSTRLFDRTRDGYVPTEAGRRMLPSAERIEREMADLERGLAGRDDRMAGVVSVTLCDVFVAELLLPDLAALCEEHPRLELSVSHDGRLFDLSKREADVAVRVLSTDSQPPEHLIGRKLSPLVIASYTSVANIEDFDPEDDTARWLAFDEPKTMQRLLADSSYPNVPPWGAFSSLELLVRAARLGLGMVMLPTYVGDCDPGLRRLPQPDLRHLADFWLLSHPDLRENARIRATRACLTSRFEELLPLFQGACPIDATDGPKLRPHGTRGGTVG